MMLMMMRAPCCELRGGSNDDLLARICVQSSGFSSMLNKNQHFLMASVSS